MSRIIIFAFLLIASLSSCKSSSEKILPEPQAEIGCRLQSLKYKGKNLASGEQGSDSVFYIYDALARLVKVESGWPDINIVYDENNLIKSSNYAPRLNRQIEYDKRGNIKKDVRFYLDHPTDDNNNTFYYFHEYDNDNHLIQTIYFPAGKHKLHNIYKPNFDEFIAAGIALSNSQTSEMEKASVMFELETLTRIKYNVDIKSKMVTISLNWEAIREGKTLDRSDEIRAIFQYDGKKSPKSSRNWRNYTMFNEGMDFSELGNLTKMTNTTSNYWNATADYAISYNYNDEGYPVTSKTVDSWTETHTTWVYNCE
jgi:hypothetical protein